MVFPQITGLFAAALTFLYLALTFRIILLRNRHKVFLGSGGGSQPELEVAIRTHANFAEFVPLAILLLGLIEASVVDERILWSIGGVLLIARIAHAIGLHYNNFVGRAIGTMGTNLVLVIEAILLIRSYVVGTQVHVTIDVNSA